MHVVFKKSIVILYLSLLQSENVLMYDSVRMVAKALDDLAQIEGFRIGGVNCMRNQVMKAGTSIAEYIRRVFISLPIHLVLLKSTCVSTKF